MVPKAAIKVYISSESFLKPRSIHCRRSPTAISASCIFFLERCAFLYLLSRLCRCLLTMVQWSSFCSLCHHDVRPLPLSQATNGHSNPYENLVSELRSATRSIDLSPGETNYLPKERMELLTAARALVSALESPDTPLWRVLFAVCLTRSFLL